MRCFQHLVLVCVLSLWAVGARAVEVGVDIAAQPLDAALNVWANQTGYQLLLPSDLGVERLTAPAVTGSLTPEAALKKLLESSGFTYKFVDATTVTILDSKKARDKTQAGGADLSAAEAMRLAQSSGMQKVEGQSQKEMADQAQLDSQEIIVTATKRAERLQDVPMSIAVMSGEDLERRGAVGMQDYLRSIPGVTQIDNGALSNAIVIRGVTTSPQFENFASGTTVATYFGETPITAAGGLGTGGIDVRPVDIERIEVLRGPQGTTHGSASLSGALRIIPNAPQLDRFDARLTGDWSNTSDFGGSNTTIQAVANFPIVRDVFAVRLVGYRYDESGYQRNIVGFDPASLAIANQYGQLANVTGFQQDNVGQMVSEGGRLAALWKPAENLSLSLNALHQTIEQDGSPVTTRGTYEQARFPVPPQGRVRGESGEVADTDIDLANAVLDYDFGWAALTTAVSWVDAGSLFAETVNFSNTSSTTAPSSFNSLTAETRLVSQADQRLRYIAGFFYEDVKSDIVQTLWWDPQAINPNGTNPGYIYDETRDLDQRAIFGELSFDLTQKLTATAGTRLFEYRKNERVLAEGGVYGVAYGAGIPSVLANKQSDSSHKFNLSYKATEHSRLYASWSDGFRLGRPTTGLPPSLCDINQDGVIDNMNISIASTRNVESDFVDNYELGGKFEFLDRRVSLDASVYYIEWTGVPMRLRAPAPCARSFTTNVGDAVSKGAEVQVGWALSRGLRLDFGASYTNAELVEDAPQLTPIPAFAGDRLPGSPRFSANFSAQYETTLGGYETFFRADSLYAGEFYGDLQQSSTLEAGDYAKLDVRAGIALKNVDLELFVRNVTNEDAYTWRTLLAGSVAAYQLRPRTFGVTLGYRFE